jgi:hypothetical protein
VTDRRSLPTSGEAANALDPTTPDPDEDMTSSTPDPSETPTQRGRSLRRAATLTASVGIAFSILFAVSFFLMLQVPGGKASDQEIYDYYNSSARVLPSAVGLYLLPFAGIAFLWFIVALRLWAAASTVRLNALQSNLQLISGIVFVALFFVGAAAISVLATVVQFSETEIDPVGARQFPIFGQTILIFFAMRMAAMFVFTTSSLARSAHILPRWLQWVGFLVGLFLLLSASFSPFLILVFPAWVLGLSLVLLRRAREIPRDARLPPGTGLSNPLGIPPVKEDLGVR